MKVTHNSIRLLSALFVFAIASFVISCKKDADPISGDIAVSVKNEAAQDSQQDEVDDMSTNAIAQADPKPGGRMATNGGDARFACALVTFEVNPDSTLGGTLTINFDKHPDGSDNPDGCTDPRGNVRKGLISINWTGGRWFKVGSVITVTLTDYSLNGVVMNGTRILTNVTTNVLKPTWEVESNITVVWPDTKTANRQVHKLRQWDILAAEIIVSQTPGADAAATGTTRRGVSYNVQIISPLIFKLSCIGTSKVYMPVQGTKLVTFNGNRTVTIDYGNGDCDNTFTVTLEGKTDNFDGDNGSSD